MKTIIDSCKKKLTSLLLFATGIALLLFSDSKWKAYDHAVKGVEKISSIDFKEWRSTIFFETSKDIKPYLDSIETRVDTLLRKHKIAKENANPYFYRTSFSSTVPKKRGAYITPELYTWEDFLKKSGQSLGKYTPDLSRLDKFMEACIAKANRIQKNEKEPYSRVLIEDVAIDYHYLKGDLYLTPNFYMLTPENKRIYIQPDTLDFLGRVSGNHYPSYLDWTSTKLQEGSEGSYLFKAFDPATIEDDSSLEEYIFGENSYSYDIWLNVKDKKVSETFLYLKNERDKLRQHISFLGMKVDNTKIIVIAPLVMCYLYVFLLLHFIDLKKYIAKHEAVYVYWVLMHNNRLGILITSFSFFFPVFILGMLLFEYLSRESIGVISATSIVYLVSVAVAILCFIKIGHLRKIYNNLPRSANS